MVIKWLTLDLLHSIGLRVDILNSPRDRLIIAQILSQYSHDETSRFGSPVVHYIDGRSTARVVRQCVSTFRVGYAQSWNLDMRRPTDRLKSRREKKNPIEIPIRTRAMTTRNSSTIRINYLPRPRGSVSKRSRFLCVPSSCL